MSTHHSVNADCVHNWDKCSLQPWKEDALHWFPSFIAQFPSSETTERKSALYAETRSCLLMCLIFTNLKIMLILFKFLCRSYFIFLKEIFLWSHKKPVIFCQKYFSKQNSDDVFPVLLQSVHTWPSASPPVVHSPCETEMRWEMSLSVIVLL